MKHNSFKITESEKNRIKNLHETVKNNPELDSSLVITEHQAQNPHRHSNPNSQSCRNLTCCDNMGSPYCPAGTPKSCPSTGYAWNGRSCVSDKKRGQACCDCNDQNPQPSSYPGGCPDVVGMVRAMGGSCREACRDFAPDLQSRKGGPEPSKEREIELGINETTYELPIRYGKKRMSESQLVKMLRRISEEQELQEKGKPCHRTSDCPGKQFCSGGGCVSIGGDKDDDGKTASPAQPSCGTVDQCIGKLMSMDRKPKSKSEMIKMLSESRNRRRFINEEDEETYWDKLWKAWKQNWGSGRVTTGGNTGGGPKADRYGGKPKGPIDIPTGNPPPHYPDFDNPLGEQKLSSIIRKVMNESQLLHEAPACEGLAEGAECYGGCDGPAGSCYVGKCSAGGDCIANEAPADGGGRISFTDIKRNGGKAAVNVLKGQGYNDKEDESLGMRRGKESSKKQSMKARRNDSRGKYGNRGKKLNERNLSSIIRKVMSESQLLLERPCGDGECQSGYICMMRSNGGHDCCKAGDTKCYGGPRAGGGRAIDDGPGKTKGGRRAKPMGTGKYGEGPGGTVYYPEMPGGLGESRLSNVIKKTINERMYLTEEKKPCDSKDNVACGKCVKAQLGGNPRETWKKIDKNCFSSEKQVGGSPDCGPGEEIGVNGECVCTNPKLCGKKGGGRKISKRKKSRR